MPSPKQSKPPAGITLWIALCALLNCAGWILSALHHLNAAGYGLVFLLAAAGLLASWRAGFVAVFQPVRFSGLKKRFRRPLPMAYLVILCLAALGGVIYMPSNYDALAYRTPRVLEWLAEGRWHWIHTSFPRVNTRSCGFEWLSAPFLVFTKSDRGFFLINIVSLVLMPGLIFSAFTRLGVKPRVAWHWMWPLSSGYCFSLQAGGIQNDFPGAPFALAMVIFALRARKSGWAWEAWLSIIAAALLTSAKPSNLPLLLTWGIAILPCWRLLLRRPAGTVAVLIIAAFSSFLPISAMDAKYTGDWTALTVENQFYGRHALSRAAANGALLCIHNLLPPVVPFAQKWDHALSHMLPGGFKQMLLENVPGRDFFNIPELASEESSGIGMGVCALLAVSLLSLAARRRTGSLHASTPKRHLADVLLLLSPFISASVLAEKAFVTGTGARFFVPYYLLLVAPFLIIAGQERVVRRRWWHICALAVMALAALLVVVTPGRPLWPQHAFLSWLGKRTHSPQAARLGAVYDTFTARADGFAPVREFLPPDPGTIGLVTYDDPETSLWRPFGTRRVRHVLPGDTVSDLRAHGITFIVASLDKFQFVFGPDKTFDQWLAEIHGELAAKIPLRLRAGSAESGWRNWAIVRLQSQNPTSAVDPADATR